MIPRASTAGALAEALPVADAVRVARLRAEAAARPLAYPLGSGQAEEIAFSRA
jgi:hypothetical protein